MKLFLRSAASHQSAMQFIPQIAPRYCIACRSEYRSGLEFSSPSIDCRSGRERDRHNDLRCASEAVRVLPRPRQLGRCLLLSSAPVVCCVSVLNIADVIKNTKLLSIQVVHYTMFECLSSPIVILLCKVNLSRTQSAKCAPHQVNLGSLRVPAIILCLDCSRSF